MDNYIQESVEAEGFILWKNSQGSERKRVKSVGRYEEVLEKHAYLCLFWGRIRHRRERLKQHYIE